jgi:hypothetical protein
MATSKIAVTEGSGLNVATNSISEDAVTKQVQRVVVNTSAGVEVSFPSVIASGTIISEQTSNTDGAATAFTNFGAVASNYNYIRGYSVFNSSATAGYIDFRDGTSGAVLWTVPIPAGGGANLVSDLPLFRTSTNTALAFDVSAALTTVYISVVGFQSTS